ncbi:formate dehydrogenase accessory protein FdhE [Neobacillus sp. LXY-4]|uniref:formate dehydrogenase accessory protein FdhE n=1 Tax=Neobacillus sp. LXY-4 TaxID=3379826 RepID=UPI003EE14712
MKTSVVSKEYLNLQKEIIELQDQWKSAINPDSVKPNFEQAAVETGVPLAAFTAVDFDISLFLQWLKDLKDVLIKSNPNIEQQFAVIEDVVDEKVAERWLEEAFAINHLYFHEFAEAHQVEQWLPQFLAETILRPYLQVIAEKAQPKLNTEMKVVPGCGCPVCGEPVRLGQIEGKGQKVLHCPRCSAYWLDKKISCSHCGNNDHETIQFLTIEGDASSQIHVCEKCKGYTKVIDTRQHISKPAITLLDLNTIHLDYIAQEKGYKVTGDNTGQTN